MDIEILSFFNALYFSEQPNTSQIRQTDHLLGRAGAENKIFHHFAMSSEIGFVLLKQATYTDRCDSFA